MSVSCRANCKEEESRLADLCKEEEISQPAVQVLALTGGPTKQPACEGHPDPLLLSGPAESLQIQESAERRNHSRFALS